MGLFGTLLTAIGPELSALLASFFVWLANKEAAIISGWNPWLKRVTVVALSAAIAWFGSKTGIDISSAQAAAAGIVAVIVYKFGSK